MRYLILVLIAGTAGAADWPGFRGSGTSVTADKNLPLEWTDARNVAWKVDLPGYGQSSPVVGKDTAYVTCVSGEMRDRGYVVALDVANGRERWRHEFEPTLKVKSSFSVARAAPTPCVDADGVYAFFEGGNLLALDHAGKVRWKRSLIDDYGEFKGGHGVGSSPCQTADTLFVLVDHAGPCYLLAVDKATGKTRWKTDRDGKMSWSSPVVARIGDRDAVIASSNGSVTAYAADTGKELWKLDGVVGNTIPSATVAGDRILVGAGMQRGKEPAKDAKSNCCLTLTRTGDKPGYEIAWTAKAGLASYASPLVYEGHVYFVNAAGVLHCYDLATGKEKYAERIDGPCWATPIGAGGRIYCFGKNGVTTVVKSGPEFESLASNRLWAADPKEKAPPPKEGGEYSDAAVLYGVAVTDGTFLVRTGTKLYRIGK